jgi:hypothetical protein
VGGDAPVARGVGRCSPPRAGLVVRPDGRASAVVPRASDLALGRQVRPRRGGDQFRRDPAVAAVGDLLFGQAARADLREDQPGQPVLLRDLGIPSGVPRRERFAAVGGRSRPAGSQPCAVGAVLRAPRERLEDQELTRTTLFR